MTNHCCRHRQMPATNGHIEVRIRHHDEARSLPLVTWPIDKLDNLVDLVDQVGPLYFTRQGDGDWHFETQLVVNAASGSAYYELVAMDGARTG